MKIDMIDAFIGGMVSLSVVVAGAVGTTVFTVPDFSLLQPDPVEIVAPIAISEREPDVSFDLLERELREIESEKAMIAQQQEEIVKRLEELEGRLEDGR